MIKRIISAILILSLLSFAPIYADTNSAKSYDTRALEVLGAVGVNTAFASKATVTRGEFVAALIDFMGIDYSDKSPFYDVGISDNYYSQICTAYEVELVSGKSDRLFHPEDSITYNEAVSICVNATGRRIYAIAHGGWPSGYINAANAAELDENVVMRGDNPITGNDAAWLLFNTISCEVLEQVSFGENIEFSSVEKNTMLSLYKDIKTVEGIVNGNRLSGLYSADDMLINRANIDGVQMRDESGICDSLLGLYVTAYYREDESSENELVACFSEEKENEIIYIDSRDSKGLLNGYFSYEENGRNKKEKIEPSVPVIYNRSTLSEREEALFKPCMGYVELIDNNSDTKIDVVRITEREDYVVFAYDAAEKIIYDKEGKTLDLSENTDKFVKLLSTSGEEVSDTVITEGVIITAEVSRNENIVYAVVCDEKRYGTITESSVDEEEYRVTLSDEELLVAPSFAQKLPYDILSKDGGIYYLNAYGYISAFAQSEKDFVYVISVYYIEEDQSVSIRCMDKKGSIDVIAFSEEYKLNGTKTNASDGMPTVIQKGDVVLVSRNGEGKITAVSTPDSSNGIYSFGEMVNAAYSDEMRTFNGKFIAGADTVIMECPMLSRPYEEDEYRIMDVLELADGESYTARAFVTDENSIIPEVIVIYTEKQSAIKRAEDCVLVNKIQDTVNEEGETVRRVHYYLRDSEKYVDCINTGILTDAGVGVGDIIKFSTNRKGYMTNVDKIYSARTNDFNSESSYSKDNGIRNGFRLVSGNIYNREDNVIGIYKGNPANIHRSAAEYMTIPENVTGAIYVVDTDKNEIVTKGGMHSLKDYKHFGTSSKVLIYTRYAVMRMIVVYE